MKNKIILLMVGLILCLYLASAQIQSLPPVKQNSCINLTQMETNITANDIINIQYPDKSYLWLKETMSQDGYLSWYSFCNTTQLGNYIINGNNSNGVWAYDFEVTPSGSEQTTAQGLGSIAFIILIITLTFILGYLGYKFINNEVLWAMGIFFGALCLILLVYNFWLLYEFKLNYTGSSPDAGVSEVIFYIFMTILTAGIGVALVMLFTKWKVIKKKFKEAIKPEKDDEDDLI